MKKIAIRIIVDILILAVIVSAFFIILRVKISRIKYVPTPPQYALDIEKVVIKEGDVLSATFKNTRLSQKDSSEILQQLRKDMNINRSMPKDFYEVLYSSATGEWTKFWYYPSGGKNFYSLSKSSDGAISIENKSLGVVSNIEKKSGTIESSLWESMSEEGIPAEVILSFADIFAWQIDFLTDTRRGDMFKVIYEIDQIAKKESASNAHILAAQYKTSSKTYTAVFFKTKNGEGYFDEEGKSVKSAFLKAPLQYRRISSYFTTRRMHPILKYVRPHLGIDYAAPTGTPVSAIADGTVTKAQYSGGFGNLVIVKHSNGYQTQYGHLSKYGAGVRKGKRVSQGQVIGYVGMTGLATGPHLDFRISKNGTLFNFLTMKMPPNTMLKGNDKAAFIKLLEETLRDFATLTPEVKTN